MGWFIVLDGVRGPQGGLVLTPLGANYCLAMAAPHSIVAALLGLTLIGCSTLAGSGTPMTESRDVEAFDSIALGEFFELVVHVDPSAVQRVEISGDDNIVPEVITNVSSGELEIYIDGYTWFGVLRLAKPKLGPKVEVWVPSLTGLQRMRSGMRSDIEVERLHGERFTLHVSVSGAGSITPG
jgi:hypothetical protein